MIKKEIYKEIFVYENFLEKEKCNYLIDFINNNSSIAILGKNNKRQTIPIGSVPLEGTSNTKSIQEKIKLKNFPKEVQDIVNDTIKNIIKEIQISYQDKESMHASNMFFAKQYQGGTVRRHKDSDPWDMHLEYSAVVYLNEIKNGDLIFPEKGISHHPKAGDLIIYKSKDTTSSHEVLDIDSDRYSMPIWISKDLNYFIE